MSEPAPDQPCDPKDIALKTFFLGPQAENAEWVHELLHQAYEHWVGWRRAQYPRDGKVISDSDLVSPEFVERRSRIEGCLDELLNRFEHEVPKFSPRYLGHMFSEISLPALLGHIVTLFHNPNNISGESSRVGIEIEHEAIGQLASMVGYDAGRATGHFTSGGTLANFEALVRARARAGRWLARAAAARESGASASRGGFRDSLLGWRAHDAIGAGRAPRELELNPFERDPARARRELSGLYGREFAEPVILVPEHGHYSWAKGAYLTGMGSSALWPIALDGDGRLSVASLRERIDEAERQDRSVALVVSVVGTTELGTIDPVDEVQDLLDEWRDERGVHLWHHVDAAFGGFFCSLRGAGSDALAPRALRALEAMPRADSVTLDPHKLGYVPYASGTFIAREPRDYYYRGTTDAPYIDFDPAVDKGPYTLEGSRSAAGAVATWMTARTLGLDADGYGRLLERMLRIHAELGELLSRSGAGVRLVPGLDCNLLCFTCARSGDPISRSNQRTREIYEALSPTGEQAFIVSKTALRWSNYGAMLDDWIPRWQARRDADEVLVIRMSIMNPFLGSKHLDVDFISEFVRVLEGHAG